MNWYLQIGKNSDVVMSSKIKLIRNINGFPFKIDRNSEIQKFEDYIKENLYNIGYGLKFIKLRNLDYITKQCIVEKNLVTNQLVLTIGYDTENLTNPFIRSSYKGEITTDAYGRKIPKHAHRNY